MVGLPTASAPLVDRVTRVCGEAVGTTNVGSHAPAPPLLYGAAQQGPTNHGTVGVPPIRARLGEIRSVTLATERFVIIFPNITFPFSFSHVLHFYSCEFSGD